LNKPEYILVDELATIVAAVKTALGLSVLNYQYGYVTELNETLNEFNETLEYRALKFPLVWVSQPFDIKRGNINYYGEVSLDVFIFNRTDQALKAVDRMANNFKPVIYPIYRELIRQIVLSPVFMNSSDTDMPHSITDRYYWDGINKAMTDIVDWRYIKFKELLINNKCP